MGFSGAAARRRNRGIKRASRRLLGEHPYCREVAMKHVLFGVLIAAAAIGTPARAQNYPWCAQYAGAGGGATNCGFVSYAQCMQTLQGMGGFCVQNTQYSPPARNAGRPRSKKSS